VYNNNTNKGIPCELTCEPLPLNGLKRAGYDNLPVETPERIYQSNALLSDLPEATLCPILPTPVAYKTSQGKLLLQKQIAIKFSHELTAEASFLKQKLENMFAGEIVFNSANKPNITLVLDANISNTEGYKLSVTSKGAEIKAPGTAGMFYGIQSFITIIPLQAWETEQETIEIPCVTITDAPRFEYRGLFLDVARNFHSKQQVCKLLDVMAFYKLNKFHFHICDDEGWRVEINGLPELTNYGSKRGHSQNEASCLQPSFGSGPIAEAEVSSGCGYYTRADFIEIIKYAKARHIEIIPEIDMPGHARAAIRSMQYRYKNYMAKGDSTKAVEYLLSECNDKSNYRSVQGWNDNVINVGMESTYTFLTKVSDEILAMFTEAQAPLKCIHTGGDEVPQGVWEKSPICNTLVSENKKLNSTADLSHYFIDRFSTILAKRNIIAAGWEEIALQGHANKNPNPNFIDKNLRPYVWNNMWNSGNEDIGYKLANAGYKTVLAHVTNLYFDLACYKHPQERGYYWGSFVDTRQPWEYTPMDISICANIDHFGNTIDSDALRQKMVKLNAIGAKNILGLQGLLWSENSISPEINDAQIIMKLIALAERAWANQPQWAKLTKSTEQNKLKADDWNNFVNRVGKFQLPILEQWNTKLHYRVPTPGAQITDGKLFANILYPKLSIRYTTDNSEPTIKSNLYTKPVSVSGKVNLKAFSNNRNSSYMVSVQ
jgi:hexosaminidase